MAIGDFEAEFVLQILICGENDWGESGSGEAGETQRRRFFPSERKSPALSSVAHSAKQKGHQFESW